MSQNTELRFKVAPVWKGSYNPSTTYDMSDEVSFTAENVPVGETTDVTYGHYRSLKDDNIDPLTNDQSWLLILDLSTIETVTQQGKEYNQQFNENEALRKDNERQRVENETIRVNNELTRVSNENERKSAETRRADAENNRNSAENDRKSNEASRQTAELQRKSKEEQRVGNENARNAAETTRQTNEASRQSYENNRRSSETTRQTNESTRQTNENVRQQQEGSPTDDPNPTGSRWARYKQAENERTLLFNTSQTNRTTQYNEAEGTPEDEAAANGSRWARFKKAEETRDAIVDEKVEDITNLQEDVENLKDTKANKDGYYSQMTVGAAETLVGETIDSADYLIRPTGGEGNEVANGAASVIGMEGHTEKFNQFAATDDVSITISGVTFTRTNGKIILSGTATATGRFYVVTAGGLGGLAVPVGHKGIIEVRYISGEITGTHQISGSGNTGHFTDKTSEKRIFTSTSSAEYLFIYFEEGAVFTNYSIEYQLFDLTAIFGAGNEPSTVAEFETWLAKNVGLKPYYGYNAGSLLSAQTLGIKTYGQNLLNPTTRQARLIPYDWEDNSNVYTIKNVPSGATATFTPDATGVAETVDISGGSLDITSYGRGILELSAATSETYVCMKWDEGKDDDVVPFEEHTQTFDVRKVYGKVNGAGEYVQCFPNGLKSAGSVKDTLTAADATKVIGDVDLGTLTWRTGDTVYYAIVPNIKSGTINVIKVGEPELYPIPIAANNVQIYKGNYATSVDFKAAMSGVPIYYELDTPITYTDLVYRDGGIDTPIVDVLFNIDVDNWSIEEQLLTPYDEDGCPTAVPAKISTNYGMDAVEEIDTIKHTYVSAYNEQEFSDAQKAQARRNIGAVDENGTYPNMSVGIAKNLAGENAVEAEYTCRPSNGTIGTATGIANVTDVKGETLVWNQISRLRTNISDSKGNVTYSSDDNGKFTIVVGEGGASEAFNIQLVILPTFVTGHKYLHRSIINFVPSSTTIKIGNTNYLWWDSSSYIFNSTGSLGAYNARVTAGCPAGTYTIDKPIVIDLTLMFGEGNEPTTVEEFEALYPLDYYAYTATPVLINNAAKGIVTTGFNQWDEEWELGILDSTTGQPVPSTTRIRSKNFIPVFPSTKYNIRIPSSLGGNGRLAVYDANKNYIGGLNVGWFGIGGEIREITTPSNGCYVRFFVETTTYNNDICINLSDASKNGTYEPYEKHTFYFDKVLQGEGSLATIKGKLNGEGESVVVFPDGLRKAGNVFDEIKGNVAIKRIGSVDLGTLDYTLMESNNAFRSSVKLDKAPQFSNNAIMSNTSNCVNIAGWGQFVNYTDSFSIVAQYFGHTYDGKYAGKTPQEIKALMSGVILYYELATPETYILDQTVTGGYQVNANGTERRLPEDTASSVNAPVNYSVIYPINAVKTIIDLPYNYISAESMTSFTTELATKLGAFLNATIAITPTYDQTNQKYDYDITITQNE